MQNSPVQKTDSASKDTKLSSNRKGELQRTEMLSGARGRLPSPRIQGLRAQRSNRRLLLDLHGGLALRVLPAFDPVDGGTTWTEASSSAFCNGLCDSIYLPEEVGM